MIPTSSIHFCLILLRFLDTMASLPLKLRLTGSLGRRMSEGWKEERQRDCSSGDHNKSARCIRAAKSKRNTSIYLRFAIHLMMMMSDLVSAAVS